DVRLYDCSGTPAADYAEIYPTAEDATYGDILVTGTKIVQAKKLDENGIPATDGSTEPVVELVKSTSEYQGTVIGIASNNYGDLATVARDRIEESDHPLPVALSGRVPLKIARTSPPSQAGVLITTRS